MQLAIALAEEGMQQGAGGPFGAVVVRNDEIIAQGFNQVTSSSDPTAHAEIVAIRRACKSLDSFQLDDCILYTSCEPCPMCLGAIYWARFKKIYYAADREDAAAGNFDDAFIYKEIDKPIEKRNIPFEQVEQKQGAQVFKKWIDKSDKIAY